MRLYTAEAIEEQMHKLLCRDCEKSDVCSICDYRELIDEILDAPTVDAEPTEEQVKEYCRKRCLVIVTNELFNEMKARWSAEPVRHGKWTHNKWSNMRHDYSCSLCGCRISGVDPFSLSATAYYYCPECGAKMDEVEDDT